MSAPSFTPGPWFAVQIEGTPSTGEAVAFVQGPRRIARDKSFGYTPEDAHLISAAPDLYKALARLLSLCEAGADPFEEPNRAVVNQAFAALSKANPHSLPSPSPAADSPTLSHPGVSGTNPAGEP